MGSQITFLQKIFKFAALKWLNLDLGNYAGSFTFTAEFFSSLSLTPLFLLLEKIQDE